MFPAKIRTECKCNEIGTNTQHGPLEADIERSHLAYKTGSRSLFTTANAPRQSAITVLCGDVPAMLPASLQRGAVIYRLNVLA